MKKNIFTGVLTAIVASILFYFAFSFGNQSLNPSKWSENSLFFRQHLCLSHLL